MADKVLWNVKEAAEALGLSEQSVYHRVSKGTLPYVKIGTLVRFRPKELQRWVSRLTTKYPKPRARTATTTGRAKTPRRSTAT